MESRIGIPNPYHNLSPRFRYLTPSGLNDELFVSYLVCCYSSVDASVSLSLESFLGATHDVIACWSSYDCLLS